MKTLKLLGLCLCHEAIGLCRVMGVGSRAWRWRMMTQIERAAGIKC